MKKKDLKDLREKGIKEINKAVAKNKQEVAMTGAKMKAGQEKKIKKVKHLRREIAQMLTIIREKEILEEESKKETKDK